MKNKTAIKDLLKVMKSSVSAEHRETAAYDLSRMGCSKELAPDFIACLADENQLENVRGQAAEALANLVHHVRKNSRLYRLAEKALITNLTSSSPVVRFWCCFALGSLRSNRAMKQLSKLRQDDHAICPGWWKISEEAADALHSIRTGCWPAHERTKIFTH